MWRFLKTCLAMTVFRAVLALALPPLVLAHEAPRATPSLDTTPAGEEGAFLRENETAMAKMMRDMAADPTGDSDRDFVAMMAPHHQGAIDMAKIVLAFGSDPELKALAEGIVKAQEAEIAQMDAWLKKNGK